MMSYRTNDDDVFIILNNPLLLYNNDNNKKLQATSTIRTSRRRICIVSPFLLIIISVIFSLNFITATTISSPPAKVLTNHKSIKSSSHNRRRRPFFPQQQQQQKESGTMIIIKNQNKETSIQHVVSSKRRIVSNNSTSALIPKKTTTSWMNGLKNALCSSGAAACSKTMLQPIDAIKTMQQYYQTSNKQSLTIIGACKEIIKRPGGISNFYSGLSINVLGSIPSIALYFGVYSYCKQTLLSTKFGKENKLICIASSAAIGNTIASFSRVPYEVLKQQLQTGVYTSTYNALYAVFTTKGQFMNMIFPKGGIAIQMIRDVPYAIVTLLVYESLQSHYSKKNQIIEEISNNNIKKKKQSNHKNNLIIRTNQISNNNKKNKIYDFILGGIAGGIGSYITNPMDVIKTRIQTNSKLYNGSVILCMNVIYNEGGTSAFLRGSIPRLIHKIPANAFFFMFYEIFRTILKAE